MDQDKIIQEQISIARSLYASRGKSLVQDTEVCALLERYRRAIHETWGLMRTMGIPQSCAGCAEKASGGCCFTGIESGYDPMLLLVNLMLGCNLPDAREDRRSCYFVGKTGCKLLARYYFCVHYVCPTLRGGLGSSQLEELLQTVGMELHAGLEVELAIRRRLAQNSP